MKNKISLYSPPPSRWTAWAFFAFLLLLWEGFSRSGAVSPLYLPAPSVIIITLAQMAGRGELGLPLADSLKRIAAGYLLGAAFGISLGILFGISRQACRLGMPLTHFLYPIPKLALLPLFILWFGIGETPKILLIAMGVFFPVLINTYSGVTRLPPIYVKVSMICGLTYSQYIRKVLLLGLLFQLLLNLAEKFCIPWEQSIHEDK